MASFGNLEIPSHALQMIESLYNDFPDSYGVIWQYCMTHLPTVRLSSIPDSSSDHASCASQDSDTSTTVELQPPDYFSSCSPKDFSILDKDLSVEDIANTVGFLDDSYSVQAFHQLPTRVC